MIKKMKSEQGIALITLAITVLLLVIITSTLAINAYTSFQLSNLTKLQSDVETLNDRVAAYFVNNGKLPTYREEKMTKSELRSILNDMYSNDGENYYVIDLNQLDNLTLNYGQSYRASSSKDKYIINEETHVVYYLQGINYEGKEYHTVGTNSVIK